MKKLATAAVAVAWLGSVAGPAIGTAEKRGAGMPRADDASRSASPEVRARALASPEVRSFGSLRTILHEGKTDASASLSDWTPSPSLVAVGALSELRGEITIVDGRIYLGRPTEDGSAKTIESRATDAQAALLVLAEVSRWIDIAVPEAIPFDRLDDEIRALAEAAGVDTGRPFPFVVEGPVRGLEWHTIDGRRVEPGGGHASHLRASVREGRAEGPATLIGFWSDAHEGVFTHLGSRTHVHAVVTEPLSSGHVDAVTILAGAKLRLPDSLVSRARRFRSAVEREQWEPARALMAPDARRWWEAREGDGQPWRIGPGARGPWADWDRQFRSQKQIVGWKESDRSATAIVRETNDYFRLLERGWVTTEVTYFFDASGRIDGQLIRAEGERDIGRTREFLDWARAHDPDELDTLMPDGEIDPSGDHPERFRELLLRWRRSVGLDPR